MYSSCGGDQAVEILGPWLTRGENFPHRFKFHHGLSKRIGDAEIGIPHHGTKVICRK
jgi:hypothetical protein